MGERAREPVGRRRRFLHLAALTAFVIAEPALVTTNPTLFVSYGSARVDVFVGTLLFFALPPLLLFGVEEIAGRLRPGLDERLHLVIVGGLGAVGVSIFLIAVPSAPARLLGAIAGGVAFAFAYRRFGGLRKTLTVLSPVPIVFALLYLFASPVSDFTLASQEEVRIADVPARAPVVVVVLDELPVTSLMDARERVDARRFPNFARLARRSNWYRNATTVHWETHRAVPALLSGSRSGPDDVPSVVDHPHNLFTLLGNAYEVNASEPYTGLCPERLCHKTAERSFPERLGSLMKQLSLISTAVALPVGVRSRLGIPAPGEVSEDDPTKQVNEFVHELGPPERRGKPRLDVIHALLPHIPWERMPSGKRYTGRKEEVTGLAGSEKWDDDPQRVLEGRQRHLLQLAYADRLLGRILDRLERSGAYDRSLVVLVADHGLAFKPDEQRREANRRTVDEILPVPLFVKLPGQRRGQVLDRHVETIDVVPTIADALDIELPFEADGRSAFAAPDDSDPAIHGAGEQVGLDLAELRHRRRASLARQIDAFGTGPLYPALFAAGPRADLIGRRVRSLPRTDGELSAELDEKERLDDVDIADEDIPTRLEGTLSRGGRRRALAVAVNGMVAATTRTFSSVGGDRFAAIVPEQALRDGANEVELFEIAPRRRPLIEVSVED